jgi:hypothetical protein
MLPRNVLGSSIIDSRSGSGRRRIDLVRIILSGGLSTTLQSCEVILADGLLEVRGEAGAPVTRFTTGTMSPMPRTVPICFVIPLSPTCSLRIAPRGRS